MKFISLFTFLGFASFIQAHCEFKDVSGKCCKPFQDLDTYGQCKDCACPGNALRDTSNKCCLPGQKVDNGVCCNTDTPIIIPNSIILGSCPVGVPRDLHAQCCYAPLILDASLNCVSKKVCAIGTYLDVNGNCANILGYCSAGVFRDLRGQCCQLGQGLDSSNNCIDLPGFCPANVVRNLHGACCQINEILDAGLNCVPRLFNGISFSAEKNATNNGFSNTAKGSLMFAMVMLITQ